MWVDFHPKLRWQDIFSLQNPSRDNLDPYYTRTQTARYRLFLYSFEWIHLTVLKDCHMKQLIQEISEIKRMSQRVLHKPDIKSYTETKTFQFQYMYENMNNNPKNRSILCFCALWVLMCELVEIVKKWTSRSKNRLDSIDKTSILLQTAYSSYAGKHAVSKETNPFTNIYQVIK